jgi:uncharacterized damage-inducible protein DinB
VTDLAGAVRQLLLYTMWADRSCLKAVEGVRGEDLARETGTSFGSMLGTLAHILCAQRIWLARFEGKALDPVPAVSDYPDGATLTAAWGEVAAEVGFLIAALTGEQLHFEITWTNSQGITSTRPLWQAIIQLVNHSTYHRGQVVSLMRQLGYPPPTTDFIYFLREQTT